jgi:hypothetical protein
VGHGVDPDRVAENAIREHEREAAHDATLHTAIGSHIAEQWAGGRKGADQPHGTLDGCVEALTTTGSLQLVPVGRRIELSACRRRELDASHDRF